MGGFNDNFFKNALVILITYQSASLWGFSSEQLVVLCGGLFILPYFLFSATAGQIADRLEKAQLIVAVKVFEIAIMAVAAYGFLHHQIGLLLIALFLMGVHSTIFGPVKYSYLPQLMHEESELIATNALFQMGTFLAILLGTISGGLAIASKPNGELITSIAAIALAILGLLFSLAVLPTGARNSKLKIDLNPITPTWHVFRETVKHRDVFLSILGISWFWFFGSAMLSLFPSYGKNVLHGSEHVVTFFLALFSIGIGAGSMLCQRLSGDRLEIGLVPFGSLGLTLFTFDLFFATPNFSLPPGTFVSLSELLFQHGGWRIAIDMLGISISGGLFIVPLMTLIQQRGDKSLLSRIIASNNILNALAMVLAAILLMAFFAFGLSIPTIFAILAVINLLVMMIIYRVMPEFTLRFAQWIFAHSIYRIHAQNLEKIPEKGACVLICNHMSYVDWIIIQGCCRRPIRFVMDHMFLKIPFVGFLFRDAKVIPIAQARENAELKELAFKRVSEELRAGEVVCIFPEGKLSRDGKLNPFRGGIERILQDTPVPVVPIALDGLWDSIFSKNPDKSKFKNLYRWGKRLDFIVGDPMHPEEVSAASLDKRVRELLEILRAK